MIDLNILMDLERVNGYVNKMCRKIRASVESEEVNMLAMDIRAYIRAQRELTNVQRVYLRKKR